MFNPQKYCYSSGGRFAWKLLAVRDGVSEPYELTADSVHGFDSAFFALLAREGWKANGLPQEDEHEYRYPMFDSQGRGFTLVAKAPSLRE